ncbi:MAG: hypothetical protein [Caudoviricetes sp.]|nr:MAG: hypothetical protein [Caudoviricetes sp.]
MIVPAMTPKKSGLLSLVEEGYTLWTGGQQPVPTGTLVDVVFRDGQEWLSLPAGEINRDGPVRNASRWHYYDRPMSDDIVAYRLVPAPEAPVTGVKHDSDKPRFSLLPLKQVWDIVAVLEFGAKKYAPDNWQKVPDAENRYFDAAMRHLCAWRSGEKRDPETNLPHLAHAACCLLFLMWGDDQK